MTGTPDRALVVRLAREARVRPAAVEAVLAGREVWSRTYDAVVTAARAAGVSDIPPLAPRAPRIPPVRPCRECDRKDEELATLQRQLDAAAKSLMAKGAECAELERQANVLRLELQKAPARPSRPSRREPSPAPALRPLPAPPDPTTVELIKAVSPRQPVVRAFVCDADGAERPMPLRTGTEV